MLAISIGRGASRNTLRYAINQTRSVNTLEGNPHIVCVGHWYYVLGINANKSLDVSQYIFPMNSSANNGGREREHLLSLLPSEPPNQNLAIGIANKLPLSPDSFRENPTFLKILDQVLSQYAHEDPDSKSQAQVMVSTAGTNLMTGGFVTNRRGGRKRDASTGGASGQGGAGGAGQGGWIHVYDGRRPPEYGRIPWYDFLSLCFFFFVFLDRGKLID